MAINQTSDKLIKMKQPALRGQSALQQKQLEHLGLKVLHCPILPKWELKISVLEFLVGIRLDKVRGNKVN